MKISLNQAFTIIVIILFLIAVLSIFAIIIMITVIHDNNIMILIVNYQVIIKSVYNMAKIDNNIALDQRKCVH